MGEPRPRRLTLDPLITKYIRDRVGRGELLPKTGQKTEGVLRSFSLCFGRRPVERLSMKDIERWMALQVKEGLKPSTRGYNLSRLRGFVGWLRRRRLIDHDPMLEIHAPRRPRRVVHILEPEQTEAVIGSAPDTRAQAILWLMYVCGVRCVEVARLQVEDWNRNSAVMRVIGKGGHEREVPILPVVKGALDAYLSDFPASSGPLFRSYIHTGKGLTPNYIGDMVARWQKDAGVKLRPYDGISAHAFRRTAATELLRATNDLTSTQELLGHASPATLTPYLQRANVERVRAALDHRLAEGGGTPVPSI